MKTVIFKVRACEKYLESVLPSSFFFFLRIMKIRRNMLNIYMADAGIPSKLMLSRLGPSSTLNPLTVENLTS